MQNGKIEHNNTKGIDYSTLSELYSARGYSKIHISQLFYPVNILAPELMSDGEEESQLSTLFLSSEEDLSLLHSHGIEYVWILKNAIIPENKNLTDISVNISNTTKSITKNKLVAREDFISLSKELSRSKAFYKQSYKQTRVILDSIRKKGILPLKEVTSVVDDITSSVARNPSALLCMRGLQSADEYTYFHSINVALLASVFAQYLGYNPEEVWRIGFAGVLHDIGKQKIPLKVLNATRKLTEAEFNIMKLHPQAACEILKDVHDLADGVMEAITCHHEKFDGTGYPYGLKGDEIHPYAAILSLADVYDALTSERPYKFAFPQNKTASIIYSQKGTSFAPDMVDKFICCFGVYPIGSLVRLSNDEFAIVYENNNDDLLHPKVLKLTRRYNGFLPNRAKPVDLRTVKKEIKIVACEDCKDYDIELKHILATFNGNLSPE